MNRRDFIHRAGLAASAPLLLKAASASAAISAATAPAAAAPAATAAASRQGASVVTPNGSTLPLRLVNGVKVGHLVAGPVSHTFAPGLEVDCWGYNGGTPGPTIEATEGDRLRLYVTNRLPEPTSIHWHGIFLPNGMDGFCGLTQKPIQPGETYRYEFRLRQSGTFMYHPHYDDMTQTAMGMAGMIVVHPKQPVGAPVDRDFVLMTHEWKVEAGTRRPDPLAMNDFNLLTFNSKAYPGTAPLVVGLGDRVRIRLGNLSAMDHHSVHLHGFAWKVTGTDGGQIPAAGQWPETTVLVPVGSVRTVEFVADAPGDWAMHCHMTHHGMNQMGHAKPSLLGADARRLDKAVGDLVPGYMTMGQSGMGEMAKMGMPVPTNSIPMVGREGPFGYIDMGGMFTLLKVRERPELEDGSGWYQHPPGTVADRVTAAEMAADGVELEK